MLLSFFVLLLILLSTLLLFIKENIFAIFTSGVISLLSVLFYVFHLSPDVAITEAAVGSAISSIFFLLTITICKNKETYNKINKITFIIVALLCIIIFIIFSYISQKMQLYGSPANIIHTKIASFYIKNSHKDFGIENIVTTILGGYRGFDTLFETTVIFVAAMGVRSILSIEKNDKK